MMTISIIGCGYLGAVHAAAMASLGHRVIAVDTDPHRIRELSAGRPPFHEPGFEEILHQGLRSGRLRFAVSGTEPELEQAKVHFLAVGTPQSPVSGAADLTALEAAVDDLARVLRPELRPIVVGKSTVPVGTAQQLADRLEPLGAEVVWNPEFLREGHAVADTLHPDRIVYGLSDDPERAAYAAGVLDEIHAELLAEAIPRILTNRPTAELVKMAANAFLATKISFINTMATMCDVTGGDVSVLAEAIGHDPRIGRRFLNAGIGFGGGCLPKDIRSLQTQAEELGVSQAVGFLREVDRINLECRSRVVRLAEAVCPGGLAGTKVTVLGATFKPNSDDIRDSPALDVARRLVRAGALVRVCDPCGLPNVMRTHPDLAVATDLEKGLAGAELVVLATEWRQYLELDPQWVGGLVARKIIVDGRNALDRDRWHRAGWVHVGMGRGDFMEEAIGAGVIGVGVRQ